MAEYIVNEFFSNDGDRNTVRMRVVNKLAEEKAGLGNNEKASRYSYYVETLHNERRVYLRRPARLHNGFDFIVCVENVNFNPNGRKRNYPTHNDILSDLAKKKKENINDYKQLFGFMKQIYECKDIDFNISNELKFSTGFNCDMILATSKWLFIEQDIRYWNYSGRDMFWNEIKSV